VKPVIELPKAFKPFKPFIPNNATTPTPANQSPKGNLDKLLETQKVTDSAEIEKTKALLKKLQESSE
jgi:hypothetical protein